MAGDSFREVSSESWFGRIGNAFKGILIGVILFIVSFPLLWWNEGRAVQTAQSLAEGKGAVVEAEAGTVSPGNEGKLVHLTGQAITEETLTDPKFNVSQDRAIRLERRAEMYQWREESKSETKKKLGGGTETVTTYTYDKVWADHPIDSSQFKKPADHQNPPMPYQSESWQAGKVHVGGFQLGERLINQIQGGEPLAITEEMYAKLPEAEKKFFQRTPDGTLYHSNASGGGPGSPLLGDVRVSYRVTKPAQVSIIAEQSGQSLRPYQTKAGDSLLMLSMGDHSAQEMFTEAEQANTALTWLLRLVGFIVMAVGIYLVFNPLVVLADVLPFLGNLLGMGIGLFAGLVAAALSLVTIAVAWLFYRPVLGIGLLVAAGLVVGLIFYFGRKKAPAGSA